MRLAVAALFLVGCRAELADQLCAAGQSCVVLRAIGAVGALDQIGVRGLEGVSFSPLTALTPPVAGAPFELPVLVPVALGDFAGELRLSVSGLRGGMLRAQGQALATLVRGQHRVLDVTMSPFSDECDGACPREIDCLDGLDDDGDRLADCEDPDCDDRVVCVESVDAGQLGWFAADGGCDGEEPLFAGLEAGGCPGCGCRPEVACFYSIYSTTTATCNTFALVTGRVVITGPDGVPPANCDSLPSERDANTLLVIRDTSAARCASVSPSPLPLAWRESRRFCPVGRASSTCGAGRRCVARDPAGAAPCLRLPDGESCPALLSGDCGLWHRADEVDDPRVCGCGCRLSGTPACDGSYAFTLHTGTTCAPAEEVERVEGSGTATTCHTDGGAAWPSFRSTSVALSGWTGAGCSADGGIEGSARAVGGTRVCCPM